MLIGYTNNYMKTLFRFFFLISFTFSLLFSKQINIEKASIRTSFENVKISSDEDMGLMGLNYLLEPNDNFYYGVGLYGALSGTRGGFFVGGFNLGLKYPIYLPTASYGHMGRNPYKKEVKIILLEM